MPLLHEFDGAPEKPILTDQTFGERVEREMARVSSVYPNWPLITHQQLKGWYDSHRALRAERDHLKAERACREGNRLGARHGGRLEMKGALLRYADALGHKLRLGRFGWFRRVCDAYDDYLLAPFTEDE